ncbi:4578_t:CDS:2 [Acaulospora colombiana]|uniref:4578_t:CDS:1 n=1 Tax=Acaulospora colombiana TaxID=27376 RepID=A0ACA9JZK5_9GLOM|nr:4578_t:CDS:2 [Acaulospora colombiana]
MRTFEQKSDEVKVGLIAITPLPANSEGKHTVAKWLISEHGFTLVSLRDSGCAAQDAMLFEGPNELLLHVTKNWRSNFVTCNVETNEILELYSLTNPLGESFQELHRPEQTLEEFVKEDDERLFQLEKGEHGISKRTTHDVIIQADLTIINSYPTLAKLYSHLKKLDITNSERLRPSWENYFMHLSDLAALRSNCMKRRTKADFMELPSD